MSVAYTVPIEPGVRRHRCQGCDEVFICELCTKKMLDTMGNFASLYSARCQNSRLYACSLACRRKVETFRKLNRGRAD